MKKRIILTIFLIILSAYSLAAKEKLRLKIGTYENSPKIFTNDNGEIIGFWADITKYIALQDDWEIEWIYGNWNQCLQRLENNEIDIMVDVGVTPARQERFAFSDETVLLSWTRIYKKSGSDIQTILDLEGKKIAGLKGSFDLDGPEGLKAVTKKFEVDCEIIEMEDYLDIFQALENNEIDAGITDKDFGNIHDINFNIEKTSIIFQPAHMQFAFSKDSKLIPYLIEKIDFQINELKKDNNSIYYSSIDKYLGAQENITIFPLWIKIIITIIFFLIVISFIFNRILRHQVVKKTIQLSKSEEQFRLFAENVPGVVSIYEWYPDGHREYIYKGPGLKDIIGEELAIKAEKDPDEYFKLIPEEDFKALDEASIKALKNNEPLDFEYRLKIDDSNTKWVRALFSMLIKEKGVILWQGIIYDITQKKKAEGALEENEERYRQIYQFSPDSIIIHDMDMNILDANNKAIEEFGYSKVELIKKTIFELHPETELKHSAQVLDDIKKKDMLNVEIKFVRKDGSVFLAEATPCKYKLGSKPIIHVVIRDITERKLAEKIHNTLYNISNTINTTDNMHLLCQKVREFLGDVIDTKNFYVALYDEKTDVISLPFEVDEKDKYESFPAGKTLTKYVIQLEKPLFAPRKLQDELTKQGKIDIVGTPSEIWLGVPLKVENKVIGVIAVQSYDDPNLYTEKDIEILTFISEEIALAIQHKQAEEQIRRDLKEKLLLLREVHHRTKNNLQTINSLLQLQKDTIKTKEDAIKSFEVSQDRIRAMAQAYEILLGSEYMSEVTLDNYITSIANQLKRNYDLNNIIQISYKMDKVKFEFEKLSKVGLIVNELLTNAMKYAFIGRENGKIHIELKESKKQIEITISDNGVGIPDEVKIPEPTTLGLSLVDMLISEFNGTYSLDRKNGTSFKLSIPKINQRT